MPRRMRPTSAAAHPLRVDYVREPDVSELLDRDLHEPIAGCCEQPRMRVVPDEPLTERAWPEGPVDLRGQMF